jgi:hypothetical protein
LLRTRNVSELRFIQSFKDTHTYLSICLSSVYLSIYLSI